MALVDLQEVKDFLGITGTTGNARLGSLLNYVISLAEQQLGGLSRGDKTITVKNSEVKNETFFLPHINPISIKAINGTDTTLWVNGTQYKIHPDGTVTVTDLGNYTETDWDEFSVTYIAGWEEAEVPDDFLGIICSMVGALYAQELGKNVTQESTGPHSTTYQQLSDKQNADILKPYKRKLSKYLPLYLKTW